MSLSDQQLSSLLVIADTLLPSIVYEEAFDEISTLSKEEEEEETYVKRNNFIRNNNNNKNNNNKNNNSKSNNKSASRNNKGREDKKKKEEKEEEEEDKTTIPHELFWSHDLMHDMDFRELLILTIKEKIIDSNERNQLLLLLWLLSTILGTWIIFTNVVLTNQSLWFIPFNKWNNNNLQSREDALKSLQRSCLWQKRKAFMGLKRLICGLALSYIPSSTTSSTLHELKGNNHNIDDDNNNNDNNDNNDNKDKENLTEEKNKNNKNKNNNNKNKNKNKKIFNVRQKNPYWNVIGYDGPYHWYVTKEQDEGIARLLSSSKRKWRKVGTSSEDDGGDNLLQTDNNIGTTTKTKQDAEIDDDDDDDEGDDDDVNNGPFDFMKNGSILDLKTIIEGRKKTEQLELEFDCVIVGSGCGGSVAAATLSRAGYKVLVIEKGSYIKKSQLSQVECESFDKMYERNSLLTSDDGNIMILAGSTFGGGSAINWSCCIDTPKHVREEWSTKFGLHQFQPKNQNKGDFDDAIHQVKKRIGVCDSNNNTGGGGGSGAQYKKRSNHPPQPAAKYHLHEHNGPNKILIHGCKEMGYSCHATGQNMNHTDTSSAGYICFGDRYGNKQDVLETYLKDAALNGCKFLTNCIVERIMKRSTTKAEIDSGLYRKDSIVVTGVVLRVTAENDNHDDDNDDNKSSSSAFLGGDKYNKVIIVKAMKNIVICSAGSIHTPCLLLRSGFQNKHIGRHLHLHPVTAVLGIYENLKVKGWLGAPMTSCCDQFKMGIENNGYGPLIECPSAHPGIMGAALPWKNGIHFKRLVSKASNSCSLIILQRDYGEGRVTLSSSLSSSLSLSLSSSSYYNILLGKQQQLLPKITYHVCKKDQKNMAEGVKGAQRILIASGASFVTAGHHDDPGLLSIITGKTEFEEEEEEEEEGTTTTTTKTTTMGRGGGGGKGKGKGKGGGGGGQQWREQAESKQTTKYLQNAVDKLGMDRLRTGYFSAHQMGTCRMGTLPSNSVTDENGQVWECEGLYIMDASLFPTASGSNPMITTLALSQMLSHRLVETIKFTSFQDDDEDEEEEENYNKNSNSKTMEKEEDVMMMMKYEEDSIMKKVLERRKKRLLRQREQCCCCWWVMDVINVSIAVFIVCSFFCFSPILF